MFDIASQFCWSNPCTFDQGWHGFVLVMGVAFSLVIGGIKWLDRLEKQKVGSVE